MLTEKPFEQHTSIPQPSDCTNAVIANYFINGTLPEPGTVCQPNQELFVIGADSIYVG
jgi:hypothetical protein